MSSSENVASCDDWTTAIECCDKVCELWWCYFFTFKKFISLFETFCFGQNLFHQQQKIKVFATFMSLDRTISHTVCMRFVLLLSHTVNVRLCAIALFVAQFFFLLSATHVLRCPHIGFRAIFNDWRELNLRVGRSKTPLFDLLIHFSLWRIKMFLSLLKSLRIA